MPTKDELVEIISSNVDVQRFQEQHWEGSFWDYLDLVAQNPSVARNAFQRVYDMVLHFGTERYTVCREDFVRYHFFSDPIDSGMDAIFGLDKPLMNLVDFFRSAAYGYGTEKRILLLHGPVGSSKSTLARLLKKGLEYYSALEEGALYTYTWRVPDKHGETQSYECPMHEDPLKLIPHEARAAVLDRLNTDQPENKRIRIEGHLNPFCRKMFEDLRIQYGGDWAKVMDHIVVRRLICRKRIARASGPSSPRTKRTRTAPS
jgi:serine protein kinase